MPNIVGYTPWGAPIWDTDTRETIVDPTNAGRIPPPQAASTAGALYGEEAAAGQRLSAQNILSQIRARDASAAASMQSAQQAMRSIGLQADELKERVRQFDITTAEGKRQFDLDFALDREKFELSRQQLQLQGAEAIINAPRGPADFFAYASRLPSVAQAGGSALGNIFGQALQNVSGESLASLQQGDVLSNSQLATDLVRASQGGAVSDATSTFLRRSLGVNVPGATQVAQQQAQQAATQQAATAAQPAPAPAPAGRLPAPGPYGMMPGVEPMYGGEESTIQGYMFEGKPYSNMTDFPGFSTNVPIIDAVAAATGTQPGDWSVGPGGVKYEPGLAAARFAWSQGAETAAIQQGIANMGGPALYKGGGINQNYGAGSPVYTPPTPYTGTASTGGYGPAYGGGGGGGNNLYSALLAGGPSFMQRLGALGGQIPRGYGTSIQEWNRFEPSAQAMYTGLLAEAGLETPEDFLSGVVKAAPNFAPSRMTRMR